MAKTIDEQVEEFAAHYDGHAQFKRELRDVLLEVVRDQREACRDAIAELDVPNNSPVAGGMKYRAQQAVMNASIGDHDGRDS